MTTKDGNEDRLTKNEFAELIQHLSVQEILTIEYCIGTKWSKLFSRKKFSTHIFICNLCVLEASSFKNLLSHIDGRKHKLQMERVKQLYHQDYTYSKNDEKDVINNRSTAKYISNTLLSTTDAGDIIKVKNVNPTKLGVNLGSNKRVIKSICKNKNDGNDYVKVPSEADMHINKTTIKNQSLINTTTLNITDTSIQNEKKNSEIENNKQDGTLNFETNARDKDKSTVVTGNMSITNEETKEKQTLDADKKNILTNVTQELSDDINASDLNKLITAKQTKDKKELKDNKNILTNDSQDTTLNSDTNSKGKNKPKTVAGKRLLTDEQNKDVFYSKKCKIIINPVAAISIKKCHVMLKEDEVIGDKNKPQYQTDKIIIPTVHKTKTQNDQVSLTHINRNINPRFSVKSYSSKPCDNDIYGILGVEYVIKILKSRNDSSPRFECGLCELMLDGFAMQKHLEGYNHRLKFCEKHFPTSVRHYRQYMQNVPDSELFKVLTPVLAKLAVAIELHHGRNLPYECYERDYNLNRHEILSKAFSCRHASEQYGPTFTHVIGSEEIDEFINNREKYFPPTSARTAIFAMKHGSVNKKYNEHRNQNSKVSDKELSRDRHRHDIRKNVESKSIENTDKSYMTSGLCEDMYPSTSVYNEASKSNIVQHLDDETYNIMVDDFLKGTLKGISGNGRLRDHRESFRNLNTANDKSSPQLHNQTGQAYHLLVDQELYKIDECFKQYRKDPEKLPCYNEEWQKFWKRRKDELVSAGLDHRKYNYQPDWVRFIKIRIEKLYSQEIENLKIKSRELLCLPMTNDNERDVKYHTHTTTVRSFSNASKSINPTTTKTVISLPHLSDKAPQVVSVLRLMTALEDNLGSLGPKIIDLLSKALQAEKTNPLNVNNIILNEVNCSLLETAKEKFKGLLLTGLFEGSKKKVLEQVIHDTELLLREQIILPSQSSLNLLNHTQKFCTDSLDNNLQQNQKTVDEAANICSEHLLTHLDKRELASKLAASLVAQGKTDFDPQQLQQLITVYKLIEKKKRENGRTIPPKKAEGPSVETTLSSKKALSDTLVDLLKSSASTHMNVDNANSSNISQSILNVSNQIEGRALHSNNHDIFQQNNFQNSIAGICIPRNTLTSELQKSCDDVLHNTAQSISNAVDVRGGVVTQLEARNNYGFNYKNNLLTSQQNSNIGSMYHNGYQNNGRTQNWEWNPHLEMSRNNNYNQICRWNNF